MDTTMVSVADLIVLCNDKVINAARDLATFTAYGINAQFIVALAGKCEELKIMNEPQNPPHSSGKQKALVSEIRFALIKLSNTAQRIWKDQLSMSDNYILPLGFRDDLWDAAVA